MLCLYACVCVCVCVVCVCVCLCVCVFMVSLFIVLSFCVQNTVWVENFEGSNIRESQNFLYF